MKELLNNVLVDYENGENTPEYCLYADTVELFCEVYALASVACPRLERLWSRIACASLDFLYPPQR